MGGAVSSRTFDQQQKPPSLENVHQWFGTVIEPDDSRTLKTSTRSSPVLASNGKLDLEDSGEVNAQVAATSADFDRAHMHESRRSNFAREAAAEVVDTSLQWRKGNQPTKGRCEERR